MCCEDNMGCQAFYLIPVKNHHVLANAATTLRKSLIFVAALPYGRVVEDTETTAFSAESYLSVNTLH